ncbi:MAG: dihydropteroate synthase [Phycisphaerales bacterium]
MKSWSFINGSLPLDRPVIVGILNVTPDSFADGGHYMLLDHAVAAAERMRDQGADMLDIGGESTRPGSEPVDSEEQIRRIVPVIEALRARGCALPISVDTTRAPVAQAAIRAGANAINDVSGGRDDADMFNLAATSGAGLVLMHRLIAPKLDQYSDRYAVDPKYQDVVDDVRAMLAAAASSAMKAGVRADRIVLDPGLGFGKSVEDNLRLIEDTRRLAELGFPIMSALSRKSFVGRWHLQRDSTPDERLEGTLKLSERHRERGAMIFRVHDVEPHVRLLKRR